MGIRFITEFLLLLACAILIIPLLHKLRLPAVTGYLLAGVLVGPGVLNLFPDSSRIDFMAEIGVVMMLFTIGLEFSGEQLRHIRRAFWIGGSVQVVLTTLMVLGLTVAYTASLRLGVFYGFLVALSSTALVLRLLQDRSELHAPQGRLALGILLFQDLSIVPMMVALPLLAGGIHATGPLQVVGKSLQFVVVLVLARLAVPRAAAFVIRSGIREIYVMTALLLCIGMAYIAHHFDFSPAFGAFCAGVIISESAYSHQIAADIIPFKGLFISIFFLSVGMLVDPAVVYRHFGLILQLTLTVLVLKTLATTAVVTDLLRYPRRIGLITGVCLAQIGEFSFVLARQGRESGLLTSLAFQVFIAVAVVSLLATPPLMHLVPLVRRRLRRNRPEATEPTAAADLTDQRKEHVIIAGFGLNGHNLARVLTATGIPFVVIELDYERGRKARELGVPVILGDVCNRDILHTAGAQYAKVMVLAISDPRAVQTALRLAREANPRLRIIVRTRFVGEIDRLYRLGADQVIPEEYETSIEIFTRTLAEYHVPKNLINAQTDIIRSEGYAMMRGGTVTPRVNEKIAEVLNMGTVETFMVTAAHAAVGRTLRDLDIRRRTGVTVIALVRNEKPLVSPAPDTSLEPLDILVLVGNHRGIDDTIALLEQPVGGSPPALD